MKRQARQTFYPRPEVLEARNTPSVTIHGDFNRDGFDDLVIGNPTETLGTMTNAGSVTVMYGSANGVDETRKEFWTQNLLGLPNRSEAGDQFGFVLAVGDFNGDGYDDLAVGSPYEDIGNVLDAGSANIILGSATGLTAVGAQDWSQDSPGVLHRSGHDDHMGWALAAGDFNGDGRDDLAIGVPNNSNQSAQHPTDIPGSGGAVILYGTTGGLQADAPQDLWLDLFTVGLVGDPVAEDHAGWALAAGDFNGDGLCDLAMGVPDRNTASAADAGMVQIVYGTTSGLTGQGSKQWFQGTGGLADAAEAGDRFGASLTTGDFNGDGRDDLAIGAPNEDVGTAVDAGGVSILYGSATGLVAAGSLFLSQAALGDAAEIADQLGASLAAADFNGDGKADLAVGAAGEDLDTIVDAGMVHILFGSALGLQTTGSQTWTQDSPDVVQVAEPLDRFGARLTAGDFNGDGRADLAVYVTGELLDTIRATNSFNLLYGGATGLTTIGNQFWYPGPAAVQNLRGNVTTTRGIKLQWGDLAVNETSYQIERSTDGTTYTLLTNLIANANSWTDSGVSPGVTYFYRVRAVNSAGGSACITTPVTVALPPAPSGIRGDVISATQVNVTWTDSSNNESGFRLERSTDGVNFTQIASVLMNVTSFSDTGLVAGTTYYYRVIAFNGLGSSAYSPVLTTRTAAPATPTGLTASRPTGSQVTLSWFDNSNNESGFKVLRSTDGVNFVKIATVGPDVTSFSDTGLTASVTYFYKVRAFNGISDSAFSNVVRV